MEKIDARKLKQEVQQSLRDRIVYLRRKGEMNKDIARFLGISEQHASTIWQKYKKGGKRAIAILAQGRRKGQKRNLSGEQEKEIQRLLIDKTPEQMRFPFALWTREAVKELIRRDCNIDMPIRTVGEYLNRWGFTPKKPAKLSREQNPKAVEDWLKIDYPEIAKTAKREKAEIYWGDETGIQNEANRIRGYAPQGQTPVIRINAKKEHISMLSAINNEGKVRFMVYNDSMTSEKLILFMTRLVKDAKRKVYLILDNLRAHHSKKVTLWLGDHKDEIIVFYLPSYSPELNPDEYLNNNLKQRVHSGLPARTEKELHKKTRSFMKMLAKRPQHVKKYFEHKKVAYAA
jgi:transposase